MDDLAPSPLLVELIRGQGRAEATLEAIASRLDSIDRSKQQDHAELEDTDRELEARVALLERWQNRAMGVVLGVGIGAGAVGGGVGALVSSLLS